MKLTCHCCFIEKEFENAEAAFKAGWDAPPHFNHVSCDLCPAVCAIGMENHYKAHDYWEKHGRPKEFGPTCFTDKDFPILTL